MAKINEVVEALRERVGVRPSALLMVIACSIAAAVLWRTRHREFIASAVTSAEPVVLVAGADATVEDVAVLIGQRVSKGQSLITLRSEQLLAERNRIDLEIRRVVRTAELARLELVRDLRGDQRDALLELIEARRDADRMNAERVRRESEATVTGALASEAERLKTAGLIDNFRAQETATQSAIVSSERAAVETHTKIEKMRLETLRRELDKLSAPQGLLEATAELYTADLNVLDARRAAIDTQIRALAVVAPSDGVVVHVLAQGTTVLAGAPVVRVVPPVAVDVVAYAAPYGLLPQASGAVAYSVTLADGHVCRGRDRLRMPGEAAAKPPQLVGFAGLEGWGMPLRVPLPADCPLPVGQVVELALEVP